MKMKTLDDLVIGRNGLWFTLEEASKAFQQSDSLFMYDSGGSKTEPVAVGVRLLGAVISKEQFQQRAKELGFVGRYRWGVEYKTDGSAPDLPSDTLIVVTDVNGKEYKESPVFTLDFFLIRGFKITDQRYKPADTSYLDKDDSSLDNGAESFIQNKVDWYDYKKKKGDIFPKAFDKVQFTHGLACWIDGEVVGMNSSGGCVIEHGIDTYATIYAESAIRPMNWNELEKKAERKRAVDAALAVLPPRELSALEMANIYYDKGFLRLSD
jgi:hypothetical protein